MWGRVYVRQQRNGYWRVDVKVKHLRSSSPALADVGQTGNEGFVVLADPEGNEFCILGNG